MARNQVGINAAFEVNWITAGLASARYMISAIALHAISRTSSGVTSLFRRAASHTAYRSPLRRVLSSETAFE